MVGLRDERGGGVPEPVPVQVPEEVEAPDAAEARAFLRVRTEQRVDGGDGRGRERLLMLGPRDVCAQKTTSE